MPENKQAERMFTFTLGNVKQFGFYRAMHNSAKRGIAIACRPSVRL